MVLFGRRAIGCMVMVGSAPQARKPSVREFTERRRETGLDYFGARYFSGAQGRFTSPDWSARPEPVPYADLTDPQTLNLYAYVRNNPLNRVDSDGHGWWSDFKERLRNTTTYGEAVTDRDLPAAIERERQWLIKNVADGQAQIDYLRSASTDTVNGVYRKWNKAIQQAANTGDIVYSAQDFVRTAEGSLVLYRGGLSFAPKPGEYKVNPDGTVKTTRGVSTNTDPAKVRKFGGAYQILEMPLRAKISETPSRPAFSVGGRRRKP